MGLRPDRGHGKSARVVGDVIGKYHPHGDGAIYDALVRMAQPLLLRLPTVDGHGNFGSLDDPPAASRYTEGRMAPAAHDRPPSTRTRSTSGPPTTAASSSRPCCPRRPEPAGQRRLRHRGRHGHEHAAAQPRRGGRGAAPLIKQPEADLDELMRFVPGPDFPTGGTIIGLDGVPDAYASRPRQLPHARHHRDRVGDRAAQGHRRHRAALPGRPRAGPRRDQGAGAEQGSSASPTSRTSPTARWACGSPSSSRTASTPRRCSTSSTGTPLEESFGINDVALVDGQPPTLGLKELLELFIDHRLEVVRRRTNYRRGKAADRLHLVDGPAHRILDIDEVIQLIRGSDNAEVARERLIAVFDLTEVQATYILDMPLRRLTRFSKLELDKERDELVETIAGLDEILGDDARSARSSPTSSPTSPRPTAPRAARSCWSPRARRRLSATPLEVADDPASSTCPAAACWPARRPRPPGDGGGRTRHDVVVSAVAATARGEVGVTTSAGPC